MMAAFRVKLPDRYGGEATEDVNTFIKTFEIFCSASTIATDKKVPVIGNLLKGEALEYYTILTKNNPEIAWDQFKLALLAVFDTKDPYHLPEQELISRVKTEDESMTSYFIAKLSLMEKLNSSMPSDQKIKHLVNGLSAEMRRLLPFRESLTLDNFLQVTSSLSESFRLPSKPSLPIAQALPVNVHDSMDSFRQEMKDLVKSTVRLALNDSKSSSCMETEVALTSMSSPSSVIPKPRCTICSKLGHNFMSCYYNPRNVSQGNSNASYNPYTRSNNSGGGGGYKGRNYDPNYRSRVQNTNTVPPCQQCGHINSHSNQHQHNVYRGNDNQFPANRPNLN